jgi:hypothetical protein
MSVKEGKGKRERGGEREELCPRNSPIYRANPYLYSFDEVEKTLI